MFVIQTMSLVTLANIADWHCPVAFAFPSAALATRLPIIGRSSDRLVHWSRDTVLAIKIHRRSIHRESKTKCGLASCKAEQDFLPSGLSKCHAWRQIVERKAFRSHLANPCEDPSWWQSAKQDHEHARAAKSAMTRVEHLRSLSARRGFKRRVVRLTIRQLFAVSGILDQLGHFSTPTATRLRDVYRQPETNSPQIH